MIQISIGVKQSGTTRINVQTKIFFSNCVLMSLIQITLIQKAYYKILIKKTIIKNRQNNKKVVSRPTCFRRIENKLSKDGA